ncbi:uncharacterized protein [Typha angustifolia]|uniref:uncharacterized protein n=1 Tax=Typha angustifolia TaxID=59011 RepID=UPI003C2E52A1
MRIRKRATTIPIAPPPSSSSLPHVRNASSEKRLEPTEEGEERLKVKESFVGSRNSSVEGSKPEAEESMIACKRNDGKGWRCKRAAASGSGLCEHHLSQSLAHRRRPSPSPRAGARKGEEWENKTKKKRKEEVQEEEEEDKSNAGYCGEEGFFYYYDGFGPSRSRSTRRAGRHEDSSSKDPIDGDGGDGGGCA